MVCEYCNYSVLWHIKVLICSEYVTGVNTWRASVTLTVNSVANCKNRSCQSLQVFDTPFLTFPLHELSRRSCVQAPGRSTCLPSPPDVNPARRWGKKADRCGWVECFHQWRFVSTLWLERVTCRFFKLLVRSFFRGFFWIEYISVMKLSF